MSHCVHNQAIAPCARSKPTWNRLAVALVQLLLAQAIVGAEMADSFEDGVPGHWKGPRKDSLATSKEHAKHGTHSLRWDWMKGDALTVTHTLGDVARTGGTNRQRKAAFGIWVWNGSSINSNLTFQFCEGDTITASFEFPLNFQGWRRARLRYRGKSQFKGTVSPKTDKIRILAPKNADNGTVFFDPVVYNGLAEGRNERSTKAKGWKPFKPDPKTFPLPKSLAPDQVRGLEKVMARMTDILTRERETGLSDFEFAKLSVSFAALGIKRSMHTVRGEPIMSDVAFYESAGLRDFVEPSSVSALMLNLAKGYHKANVGPKRFDLDDMIIDLCDHLRDQGWVVGGGLDFGERAMEDLVTAAILMHAKLSKWNRMEPITERFDFETDARKIFMADSIDPGLRFFRHQLKDRFHGALLQPSPQLQCQWLNAFGRHLSQTILFQGVNGFQPDGSILDAGVFDVSQASKALGSLVTYVHTLSRTPFTISEAAFTRMKKAMLTIRFACIDRRFPSAVAGIGGKQSTAILSNAMFLTALSRVKPDHDLIRAYLRLNPAETWERLEPEPEPQGNRCLPYAGLMVHRRKGWLASVKGPGTHEKRVTPSLDLGAGQRVDGGVLELLFADRRPIRHRGGIRWGNGRLTGATVAHGTGRRVDDAGLTPAVDAIFSGGVSHRGQHGLFAIQWRGKGGRNAVGATTSYAFFDNRIICLGSDISSDDSGRPIHTNLFLSTPTKDAGNVVVDGKSYVSDQDQMVLASNQEHLILDAAGTGYYLPKGQTIGLAQKRVKQWGPGELQIVRGWIDHGKTPKAGHYEYAVLVGMNSDGLAEFRKQSGGDEPPYVVYRKDAKAHVVHDRVLDAWACACFEATPLQLEKRGFPIVAVYAPCLIMASRRDKERMVLSIADPNVTLTRIGKHGFKSESKQVSIRLGSGWTVVNAPTRATITGSKVTVTTRDGAGITLTLEKKGD